MLEHLTRGKIISLIGVIPVAVALSATNVTAAETAEVTKKKALLEYVTKSTIEGKTCANCGLFKATSAGNGSCLIIPGGTVKAAGWCKSWAP